MLTRRQGLFVGLGGFACIGATQLGLAPGAKAAGDFEVTHSDSEWKKLLTPNQFAVLRQAATERPFSSPLDHEKRAGTFACAGCDLDLFASGLISSLFAMELIVHVEGTFGVSVQGDDLKLVNFRTIDAICALIIGLRGNRRG